MKKFLIPMLSLALFAAACDDDNENGGNPPSIEIGEVAFSETDGMARVEIKPSKDTEAWYWKYAETGKEANYTSENGNAAKTVEMEVTLDKPYTIAAYAENTFGKSKETTKVFTIKSTDVKGELVEISVKNLTAFSVDVDVKKSIKCSKYVIGAMPKNSYNEEYFIQSAETSLNPNPDYPMQPFNWSDKSATFTEYTLAKGRLATDPENTGIKLTSDETDEMNKMVVCVYALPASGEQAKVFTQDFTVPKPSNYDGSIKVQIDIADEDLTLSSVAATITADANCKKIFTALLPYSDESLFEKIADEKKATFLQEIGNSVLPYTKPYKQVFNEELRPNTKYLIYAVPIAEDGTIGKVTYKEFTTKKPVFEGTGKITSAELFQETPATIKLKLETNSDVEKVRVFCWSYDICSAIVDNPGELEWVMYDHESNSQWTSEFPKNALAEPLELIISLPGDKYCIYGATVDAKGNVSYPVNLAQLAAGSEDKEAMFETMPETQEEIDVKFDGTGELTFKLDNEELYDKNDPSMWWMEYTVTKGANTQKAFRIRTDADAMEADIEELMTAAFATYFKDGEIDATSKELFTKGDSETEKIEYLTDYEEPYGGSIIVFVTLDNNNKLKIADYYLTGEGHK